MTDTADQPSPAPAAPAAPVAPREAHVWRLHGVDREDDYAWMATDKPRLIEHLAAERAYFDAATADQSELRATLFAELSSRVSPADDSVSWRHGEWDYFTRHVEGQQYTQFCRRQGESGEPVVVLDLNVVAGSSAYLGLGVRELSPDGSRLAYSIDTDGNEVYELRIRDLATGEDLTDVIPRSYYGCAWSAAGDAVFYTVHDEAYRPFQVMRHRLGADPADDQLVFQEDDERYELDIRGSRSGELVVIAIRSGTTSESWLIAADDESASPWLVAPRREGVEYAVDHVPGNAGGELYITTNDGAEEFRLVRSPLRGTGPGDWVDVIGETEGERLVGVDAFAAHLVLTVRRDALRLLRTVDLTTGVTRDIGAEIPAGAIRLSCRDDEREPVLDGFDATAVTVVIESLIEPPAWWSVDLATGERTHRKTKPSPGYDAANYRTARVNATAPDGAAIPVSIAYRHDVAPDGSAPGLIYGYGAYEASIDPYYDPTFASVLDRGVVYAIAHIRGGGEGGRRWWREGKLTNKRNTFTDFIAAADGLVEQGWLDGDRIASRGASAGGLLQGAALSIAPQRWRAIVAEVPFVDVVTTMLDASLPLTAGEWGEWGDPREADDFAYMLSYSPYDNVPAGSRPHLLATGSLHDSRVMVHEPAKWVAKLRATDDGSGGEVLFRAEVGSASHGGPSGRYDRLRYQAEILSWVLTKLDVS